jgi:hypothetical protein
MTEQITRAPDPPLEDNGLAPEIFVDGYASVSLLNGVAKFVFFSISYDPVTQMTKRRVNMRMTASVAAVAGISEALVGMIQELKDQGALMPMQEQRN